MDNFDQHINNTMNNPPEFPFKEELWKDLEDRMKESPPEKTVIPWLTWLPLGLLFLIPSVLAGLFYVKHNNALDRIAALEQQSQSPKITYIDTIVQKKITVIYDTIYNQVVINDYKTEQSKAILTSYQNAVLTAQSQAFTQNLARKFAPYQAYLINKENTDLANDERLNSENIAGSNTIDLVPSIYSTRTDGLANNTYTKSSFANAIRSGLSNANFVNDEVSKSVEATEQTILKEELKALIGLSLEEPAWGFNEIELSILPSADPKKTLGDRLAMLRPSSVALSAKTGSFLMMNNTRKNGNYAAGLQAEFGYNDKFNLVLGAEFVNNTFELYADNPAIVNYPITPPDDPGDNLNEGYGRFHYLQIPFGFKYQLYQNRTINPYVGLGLIAQRSLKSQMESRYTSQATAMEYSIFQDDLLPTQFNVKDSWITLGFNTGISSKWDFFFETSYQWTLKPGMYQYEDRQFLKINLGVQYEF